MPVCVGQAHPGPWWGGGGVTAQGQADWHNFALLQQAVVLLCAVGEGGGVVHARCCGPSNGQWVPYHKAAGGVYGSSDL